MFIFCAEFRLCGLFACGASALKSKSSSRRSRSLSPTRHANRKSGVTSVTQPQTKTNDIWRLNGERIASVVQRAMVAGAGSDHAEGHVTTGGRKSDDLCSPTTENCAVKEELPHQHADVVGSSVGMTTSQVASDRNPALPTGSSNGGETCVDDDYPVFDISGNLIQQIDSNGVGHYLQSCSERRKIPCVIGHQFRNGSAGKFPNWAREPNSDVERRRALGHHSPIPASSRDRDVIVARSSSTDAVGRPSRSCANAKSEVAKSAGTRSREALSTGHVDGRRPFYFRSRSDNWSWANRGVMGPWKSTDYETLWRLAAERKLGTTNGGVTRAQGMSHAQSPFLVLAPR